MPAEQTSNGPRLPAWIVSAVVHAGLLALAVMFVNVTPRGAAEEPDRRVGVVLKQPTPDGTLYEGPSADRQADDQTSAEEAARPPTPDDSLPAIDAEASFDALLPPALGLGPQDKQSGDAAQATNAGGAAGRPAGGAVGVTRTRVFNVQGEGRRFVYVFDRSASMVGPPLAAAKAQLLASLASLESVHQFHIFFFNHSDAPLSPDLTGGQRRMAFADERSKRLAAGFVSQVTADGGTKRFPALARALALRPDVVFFLTDADNPMPGADREAIARRVRRVGATICTIEFGIGPAHGQDNFLVQLAATTGGQYGYVDTTRLGRAVSPPIRSPTPPAAQRRIKGSGAR